MTRRPQKTYAVIWREGDGAVRAGKLVFGTTRLLLETGSPGGRLTVQSLLYDGLLSVAIAAPGQRIRGQPTAVVERRGQGRLAIATIGELGSVRELIEGLAARLLRGARA